MRDAENILLALHRTASRTAGLPPAFDGALYEDSGPDPLLMIVHRDFVYERGKGLIERLRKPIPRQMFEVALQAAIGRRSFNPVR